MYKTQFYSVTDLQKILGCGREVAYQLMRSSSFPSTKIGKRWFVSQDAFARWARDYEGKEFIL